MRVEQAVEAFINHCADERNLSANTISAYRQDLAEFLRRHHGRTIGEIKGEDLVAYVSHLAEFRVLAPATMRRRVACLKSMFAWLTRRSRITANPFLTVDIRVRIPARLPRCLAGGEMRRLAHAADNAPNFIKLATLVLFATGARVGELTSIRLRDIDLGEGVIRIFGKGSRERQVFVTNQDLLHFLRCFVANERANASQCERLFVTSRGRPAAAALIRARVKELARTAGLKRTVTPHMLRHTAATSLIEAGVDIRFVQRLLGHQSIATTQLYTHVTDQALMGAIQRADTFGKLKLR